MMNFAITGVAGYIAPRHLKAIKETGNNLVAACDPHDSVGIIDSYFMDCSFFTEFERFDRHLEKLHRSNNNKRIDYLSICAPNHLHDAHIRLALRLDADAICEKPLVIKPSNLNYLKELEEETGRKVYNILQLRVHPSIVSLKKKILSEKNKTKRNVVLTYITSRGLWYNYSWKGNIEKSGGVATNIGIHFFDMLMWLFGKEQSSTVFLSEPNKMSGYMELENANVRWFLSIDKNDLPKEAVESGKTTFRSIKIDDEELEFTGGFTDLHTLVYKDIIAGR
ncbi:MAG TPA: Gfo/Idh/MocA family oxidoreductase, partial [Candidatus Kapabacteria bacterium]|nr:Gfo/Idh/MocA family oxidoreductase [Candidatus Kapabacteria bacterium]